MTRRGLLLRHHGHGAVENHFWQNLCSHLGKPEYGPLQYEETRRKEIINTNRS